MIGTTAAATAPLHLPSLPVMSFSRAGGLRRQRAGQQRMRIRAAARELFAERGYAGFHINDLAERCGVAVQTLYNHLGGRDEILSSAVDELLQEHICWAAAESARTGRNFILVCCDMMARLMKADWQYVRSVISVLRNPDQPTLVTETVEARCISAYRGHLHSIREAALLKQWVNVDTLATALLDVFRTILISRAGCRSDADRLRHELLMGIGLLLQGATLGEEAQRIEALLDAELRLPTNESIER